MVISDDDIVKHISERTQESLLELSPMIEALAQWGEIRRGCQICNHSFHSLPLPLGERSAVEQGADHSL